MVGFELVVKFWVVWSPRGGPPKRRHLDRDAAQAEAERLSLRFPGRHFYVLEAAGFFMEGPETKTPGELRLEEWRRKQAAEVAAPVVEPPPKVRKVLGLDKLKRRPVGA